MAALPRRRCTGADSAALDDVSATEWRNLSPAAVLQMKGAALDDVSATEWRM